MDELIRAVQKQDQCMRELIWYLLFNMPIHHRPWYYWVEYKKVNLN